MNPTRKLLASVALAAGLSTLAGAAQAADSFWNHNGSTMLLRAEGNYRLITYWNPRPGLRGVHRGTVLFEGYRDGSHYAGTAYTFRSGCRPAPYRVTGQIISETNFAIHGAAPRRVRGGCQVLAHEWNNNSTLRFNYIRRAH